MSHLANLYSWSHWRKIFICQGIKQRNEALWEPGSSIFTFSWNCCSIYQNELWFSSCGPFFRTECKRKVNFKTVHFDDRPFSSLKTVRFLYQCRLKNDLWTLKKANIGQNGTRLWIQSTKYLAPSLKMVSWRILLWSQSIFAKQMVQDYIQSVPWNKQKLTKPSLMSLSLILNSDIFQGTLRVLSTSRYHSEKNRLYDLPHVTRPTIISACLCCPY